MCPLGWNKMRWEWNKFVFLFEGDWWKCLKLVFLPSFHSKLIKLNFYSTCFGKNAPFFFFISLLLHSILTKCTTPIIEEISLICNRSSCWLLFKSAGNMPWGLEADQFSVGWKLCTKTENMWFWLLEGISFTKNCLSSFLEIMDTYFVISCTDISASFKT